VEERINNAVPLSLYSLLAREGDRQRRTQQDATDGAADDSATARSAAGRRRADSLYRCWLAGWLAGWLAVGVVVVGALFSPAAARASAPLGFDRSYCYMQSFPCPVPRTAHQRKSNLLFPAFGDEERGGCSRGNTHNIKTGSCASWAIQRDKLTPPCSFNLFGFDASDRKQCEFFFPDGSFSPSSFF